MCILAIEQSTRQGSLALLRDQEVMGSLSWMDTRFHSQQLFDRLSVLLRQASMALDDIGLYAVGLGPGSYTGLRIAVAAAQGFCMPDQKEIYGLSSAEALAGDILEGSKADLVTVMGDARRQQLWTRRFTLRAGVCSATTSWTLCHREELPEFPPSVWVTSDWDRIGAQLKARVPPGSQLMEGPRVPTAASIGKWAVRKIQAGIPSEPLVPIYLHPAVTAPPNAANSRSRMDTLGFNRG